MLMLQHLTWTWMGQWALGARLLVTATPMGAGGWCQCLCALPAGTCHLELASTVQPAQSWGPDAGPLPRNLRGRGGEARLCAAAGGTAVQLCLDPRKGEHGRAAPD